MSDISLLLLHFIEMDDTSVEIFSQDANLKISVYGLCLHVCLCIYLPMQPWTCLQFMIKKQPFHIICMVLKTFSRVHTKLKCENEKWWWNDATRYECFWFFWMLSKPICMFKVVIWLSYTFYYNCSVEYIHNTKRH